MPIITNPRVLQRVCIVLLAMLFSCKEDAGVPSPDIISQINLKRGEVINCGPADQEFGSVTFNVAASKEVKEEFNLGVKLLHSFEYDEAEKVFARIIDEQPRLAMAYWGVAMSNFHPLWNPPTENELKKGSKAIEVARSIEPISDREADYIDAIASFYNDWEKLDHRSR